MLAAPLLLLLLAVVAVATSCCSIVLPLLLAFAPLLLLPALVPLLRLPLVGDSDLAVSSPEMHANKRPLTVSRLLQMHPLVCVTTEEKACYKTYQSL